MGTLPDPDQQLAEAMTRIPTVLPFAMVWERSAPPAGQAGIKASFAYQRNDETGDPERYMERLPYWVTSLDILQEVAAGVGRSTPIRALMAPSGMCPLFMKVPELSRTPASVTIPVPARIPLSRVSRHGSAARGPGRHDLSDQDRPAPAELSSARRSGIAMVKRRPDHVLRPASNGALLLYDSAATRPSGSFRWLISGIRILMRTQVTGRIIFIGTFGRRVARPEADAARSRHDRCRDPRPDHRAVFWPGSISPALLGQVCGMRPPS